MLLAVALYSGLPDALLLNINTHSQEIQTLIQKQQQKHPIPDPGFRSGAEYDGIERPRAQTSLAERKFSVIIHTPSHPLGFPTHHSPSHPSTSHTEKLPPSMHDDDAESVWSQTCYGNLDWDHSGDEFHNIQATPRITRRGTSVSPQKLHDFASLASGDIPGSYKSAMVTEREKRVKKAAGSQREPSGRFASKDEAKVRGLRSATLSKRKRRESTISAPREDLESQDDHVGERRQSEDRSPLISKRSLSPKFPKTPSALVRESNGKLARNSRSSLKRRPQSAVPEQGQDLEYPEAHVEKERQPRERSLPMRERPSSLISAKTTPVVLVPDDAKSRSVPKNESSSTHQRRALDFGEMQKESLVSLAERFSANSPVITSSHDANSSADDEAESTTPNNSIPQRRSWKGTSNKNAKQREPNLSKSRREESPILGTKGMKSPTREPSPILGTLATESQVSEDVNEPVVKREYSSANEGTTSMTPNNSWERPRNSNGKFLSAKKAKKLRITSLIVEALKQASSDDGEPHEEYHPAGPSKGESTSSSPSVRRPDHTSSPPPASMSSLGPVQAEINSPPTQAEPEAESEAKPKRKRAPAKSPYFPITPKNSIPSSSPLEPTTPAKRRVGFSCIPFPPLSSPSFGLIQEKLAHDPFRLLIAVTFLIRTHGKHAIPIFFQLMQKFPTPEALLAADKKKDILPIIQHLGLQNQRAVTYQTYAKIWLENPPVKGKRYRVLGYPVDGDGKDVGKNEVLSDEADSEEGDARVGWEIGHMTEGPYALDSWRIFCRDELRGLADSWNGEGSTARAFQKQAAKNPGPSAESLDISLSPVQQQLLREQEQERQRQQEDGKVFQPEWMRVLPLDKELRAYLRWMWLKEGFEWDPLSGDKEAARPELMEAALDGRLEWDEDGGVRIVEREVGENGGDTEGG